MGRFLFALLFFVFFTTFSKVSAQEFSRRVVSISYRSEGRISRFLGVVLDRSWILTAAHALRVLGKADEYPYQFASVQDLKVASPNIPRAEYSVKQLKIPKNFFFGPEGAVADLALLELLEEIPIALPPLEIFVPPTVVEGTKYRASILLGNKISSDPIVELDFAFKADLWKTSLSPDSPDVCRGASGGPAIEVASQQLLGITSFLSTKSGFCGKKISLTVLHPWVNQINARSFGPQEIVVEYSLHR